MKWLIIFLCSGASGAEGSSLAICSSSLSPAVGILPLLPLPQRGILPQQGSRSSRPSFCSWEQQGPEPAVPSKRALQGKTHQVRNDTLNNLVLRSQGVSCTWTWHLFYVAAGLKCHIFMLASVRLSNGNANCRVWFVVLTSLSFHGCNQH